VDRGLAITVLFPPRLAVCCVSMDTRLYSLCFSFVSRTNIDFEPPISTAVRGSFANLALATGSRWARV